MEARLPTTVALVLHFRTAASTAACLASVQLQGIHHLLLVDNSEDSGRSLEELEVSLRELREKGMQIVILKPSHNLGFSAGVNCGLSAIGDEFGPVRVLLINSDAQLLPGSLDMLQGGLDTGAAIAAPSLQAADGSLARSSYYHRLSGLLSARNLPGTFPYVSGCCLLLSAAIAQSGLLDERFFFYGEDVHLSWRLRRENVAVHVLRDARVLHMGSGSSRRGSLFYEYHMVRSHLELARALAESRLDLAGLLLGRCLILPIRAVWRACRQVSPAPTRGLLMAIHDFAYRRTRALTPPASRVGGTTAHDDK